MIVTAACRRSYATIAQHVEALKVEATVSTTAAHLLVAWRWAGGRVRAVNTDMSSLSLLQDTYLKGCSATGRCAGCKTQRLSYILTSPTPTTMLLVLPSPTPMLPPHPSAWRLWFRRLSQTYTHPTLWQKR